MALKITNEDNMELMAQVILTITFDLAIVDPPYGIGGKMTMGSGKHNFKKR
jgi:DNA modification methylase